MDYVITTNKVSTMDDTRWRDQVTCTVALPSAFVESTRQQSSWKTAIWLQHTSAAIIVNPLAYIEKKKKQKRKKTTRILYIEAEMMQEKEFPICV